MSSDSPFPENWQELSAAVLVVIAFAYVMRRAAMSLIRRSASACGAGCSHCPSSESPSAEDVTVFVPLEQLVASARGLRRGRRA
jgi:hypothetical protein